MDEVEEASKLSWGRRQELASRMGSDLPSWDDAEQEIKDEVRADMRRLLDGYGLRPARTEV